MAYFAHSMDSPLGPHHLCHNGTILLAAWLKAEPRLVAVLPEMLSLPPNLLTAASAAGDEYLQHLDRCPQCHSLLRAPNVLAS